MKIKRRQLIGLALMAASVLAAILIQVFTGHVLTFHTIPTDNASSDAGVMGMGMIVFYCRYDIPLAAGFVIGLVCFAWPTRKPPRIVSSA